MVVVVLAALLPGALVVDASAATVLGVAASASASSTRIVVEIDGPFRYRSGASDDGSAVLVDIDDATLDPDAPRVVPVSDRHVDGVLLRSDPASRIVRVSVDVAGPVAPQLVASVEAGRLLLDFVDAAQAPAAAAATRRPMASAPSAVSAQVAPDRAAQATVARAGDDHRSGHLDDFRTDASREPAIASDDAGPATRAARPGAIAKPLAARTTGVAAPASRSSVLERPLVILDPGHGGKDPGARAWTGEWEKDIVLDIAERVARRLRQRGDVEVVMTRSDDRFIELADRREASARWDADAFVSIHANASPSGAARGVETYYHSRSVASSDSARGIRRLARAENGGRSAQRTARAKGASAASVSRTSSSSSSAPRIDRRPESARLAKQVQEQLVSQLGMRYEAVRDLGAKEGPFFVIGDNAAPSVLVEAAFLTHREEGVRMGSEVYREQLAEGIARGIVLFLEQQRRAGAL